MFSKHNHPALLWCCAGTSVPFCNIQCCASASQCRLTPLWWFVATSRVVLSHHGLSHRITGCFALLWCRATASRCRLHHYSALLPHHGVAYAMTGRPTLLRYHATSGNDPLALYCYIALFVTFYYFMLPFMLLIDLRHKNHL